MRDPDPTRSSPPGAGPSPADAAPTERRRRGRRLIDWTAPDAGELPPPGREARRRAGRETADEAGELAERLMALPEPAFARLVLDAELGEMLRGARAMRRDSAQRRTIRNIAGLLRLRDRAPLIAALRQIEAGKEAAAAPLHRWEGWRDRLLAGGEGELDALLAAFPHADRHRLQGLVQQARQERAEGRAPRAFRELFRALKGLDGD